MLKSTIALVCLGKCSKYSGVIEQMGVGRFLWSAIVVVVLIIVLVVVLRVLFNLI
jgi:hypothetical protein